MDYINKGLMETGFSGRHILNFLYNSPEEDRAPDMPRFDWRNIFNLTDQVIRLINRYGEVFGPPLFQLLSAAVCDLNDIPILDIFLCSRYASYERANI